MTKKELILDTLQSLGCKYNVDDDGDIVIRYQMKSIIVVVGDDAEKYISVILPQLYEIGEGEEPLVLAVCNKVTREIKMMKTIVDETFTSVSASCEFYYTDSESLSVNIKKSLELLGFVRSMFRKEKASLEE